MAAYLPSLLTLVNGIIFIFIGVYVTRYWRSIDARNKAAEETANDKKQWRDGRVATETALKNDIQDLRAAATKSQLSYEADMARIAEILKRFVEVSEQHTTMTEQMKWHGKTMERHDEEFKAVHRELQTLHNDIKDLFKRDA